MSFNPFVNGGGGTSSEDKVARAEIAAIKDGETLDSFSDVETALDNKANKTDILSLDANKLDKTGTAAKATADSAGNNIITTYAKKTDLNNLTCTYRGTYTTAEALNAASGDKNDFAFLKTTDSAGNEIYSRYRRVEIPQVVPEGYTQLMYITSNGTQYIDTGVQAKRDLKTYVKFARKNANSRCYFGVEERGCNYALRYSDWRYQLFCEVGNWSADVSSAISSIDEFVFEYPTVTVNGTVFNISAQADFTSEKTIYLCGANGNDNGAISLYECIIYDDDKTTELKHFYPCKNSSNVCGMYETVEGVFYPDANGGNFAAGPQANGYWNFEYSIPGNLFSSAQFAALNSGINTTKVNQIETNKNNIVNIKDGTNIDSFSDVEAALSDKVDKETGKGLSTNDYTTAEKEKLAGIAEGAEVNEIQGIKVNSSTVNPDANKVVNITVPTSAADVSALPDTTKYAAALSLTINSSTFVMTGQLKDQNGDNLGTAQTIDLPLESVVVGGSYNSQTKKVVLTLQNGNTIEFSVADLVSGLQTELSASNKLNPAYINYDSTHRAVSDTEKSTWNGKQNALSEAQLAAVNSGINSAKVEQIETNKNNILSLTQYGGGINKFQVTATTTTVNGITFTVNSDKTITATGSIADSSKNAIFPIGSYSAVSGDVLSEGFVEANSKAYIYTRGSSTNLIAAPYREILADDIGVQRSYACVITADTIGQVNITFKPMICNSDSYAKSGVYQPYAMSNAELTAKEQQNENNILFLNATAEITGWYKANETNGLDFDYAFSYAGTENVEYGFLCYRNGILNLDMTFVAKNMISDIISVTKTSPTGTLGVSDKGYGVYLRPYIKIGARYKYGEQVFTNHADAPNQ